MSRSDSGISADAIHLRRAYEAPEAGDGVRVLVDRLWPRGVSKTAAHLDAWMAALGPSDELRTWFGHQPERWPAFVERYRDELASPLRRTLLASLQSVATRSTLTLVYGARDTEQNEAVVLRQHLLQETSQPPALWDASTKLLLVMAVVAAAHHDAVAPTAGVELFGLSLLTAGELANARARLLHDDLLRPVPGGWRLTARALKQVRQLAEQRPPDPAST
jgi:uncharacterized protein YeaO (DUF488 family)